MKNPLAVSKHLLNQNGLDHFLQTRFLKIEGLGNFNLNETHLPNFEDLH